jgi:hypothetical protein
MSAQELNRTWVSWYWGAVFLTFLPALLLVLTFVTPKGPEWWVWFVDVAPGWLMWIVRALLVGWVAAAWKLQTWPLLQDLRQRRESASGVGRLAEMGAAAESRVHQSGPVPKVQRDSPTSGAPDAIPGAPDQT